VNGDAEGAREVSMHWVGHRASHPPESDAPDFIHSNKKSVSARISTSRDQKFFRREHDDLTPRYGTLTCRREAERKLLPSDVVPGFTYGRKIRPSTPIQEVISNRSAERSERALTNFYNDFSEQQELSRAHIRKIPLTKASRGHASRAMKATLQRDEQPHLFKIGKFKRTSSKVDHRRRRTSEALRDDMSDDSSARSGSPDRCYTGSGHSTTSTIQHHGLPKSGVRHFNTDTMLSEPPY
jgi:hypothetical protein